MTAAFILGPGGFGRLMRQGVDPASRSDIVWHETLGVLVFVMTIFRLVWVALRPRAPNSGSLAWMDRLAKVVHVILWALLVVLPITAVLALGTEGHPMTLMGGLRVQDIPFLKGLGLLHAVDWGDVHGYLGDTLMWLAGLHALAALYHHLVLKDDVLRTMLPGR